jgi:hypothetical protein
MSEQELDLFKIASVLSAEFDAGAAEVVSAEVFYANLLR